MGVYIVMILGMDLTMNTAMITKQNTAMKLSTVMILSLTINTSMLMICMVTIMATDIVIVMDMDIVIVMDMDIVMTMDMIIVIIMGMHIVIIMGMGIVIVMGMDTATATVMMIMTIVMVSAILAKGLINEFLKKFHSIINQLSKSSNYLCLRSLEHRQLTATRVSTLLLLQNQWLKHMTSIWTQIASLVRPQVLLQTLHMRMGKKHIQPLVVKPMKMKKMK